jgi:hypothetical protein
VVAVGRPSPPERSSAGAGSLASLTVDTPLGYIRPMNHSSHHDVQPTSHDAGDHDMHHDMGTNAMALSATLHCLTGCAIGEILGLMIGTALGLGNLATIAIAVGLAFPSATPSRRCRCCAPGWASARR